MIEIDACTYEVYTGTTDAELFSRANDDVEVV